MTTSIVSRSTVCIWDLSRHIIRSLTLRKEVILRQLDSFVLELLAAIVLIAIFLVLCQPERQADIEAGQPGPHSSS